MLFTALVLLVSLTLGLSSSEVKWQLDLVQILFRNGISAPEVLYPNDPNHPDTWEEGMGHLTLAGQKQLYTLGKYLKNRYSNFLTSNPTEVKVKSTYLEKCMSSALCLLASLYEPDKSWEFIPGLNWQPIPVGYEPSHEDRLLKSINSFKSIGIKLNLEDKFELDMFQKQLAYWTSNSGMAVNDFFQASALYKILCSELISNHTIPQWVWMYWHDLQNMNDFSYQIAFNNPTIAKMIGGPLLYQMVRDAMNKSEGKTQDLKIYIYSGQSYHLAGLLGVLNCFNGKEPPFAATFIMELFKRRSLNNITNFDYAVKLSYFDGTEAPPPIKKPMTLVIPGCEEMCPLTYLVNFTKSLNKHSWRF